MIPFVLFICNQKCTTYNVIERDYFALILRLHMPPVNRQALVDAPGFNVPRLLFQ